MIHTTAVVDPRAELAADVEVGPYAVVGPDVRIGEGTSVGSHSVLLGRTTIGARNRIFHHASVGAEPQDLKYRGEPTTLEIGDENLIREFATVHTGTVGGGGVTSIGNRNLLMNFSHVAHDSRIGDGCVLANGATLAGHVIVEDHVIVGGLVAVHQFVRVGSYAMLGGGAMVAQDVPPFCLAQGDRARLVGLNQEGLRRRGFDDERIRAIRRAYLTVFRRGRSLEDGIRAARSEAGEQPDAVRFLDFVASSERGVCRPRSAES